MGNHKSNRLIKEKSPYLLQHAYNPVDWYPWGEEAFKRAKAEDKPVFLSIGYSTCHWCHVMERESFEDEVVAAYLKDHYIAVKVDREERPDVDHIYMTVCQAMTGHGGWPLTVVMTPDKKPFFSGTYFPKRSKWGRPGIMEVLEQLSEKWIMDRASLLEAGEQITEVMKPKFTDFISGELDESILHFAFEQFAKDYDSDYGGFGTEPKFPTPSNLMFLLRYWKKTKKAEALKMVEKTLDAMYKGGVYDHIGFGFARYSTDREWLVPHFEKMLYDNALLAYSYLEAYQATNKQDYARVAEEIFTYVLRDMTHPEGGFYSAEDADSEGVEGKFYVWSPAEIISILGEKEGSFYCSVYDITTEGNFEGENIPNLIHQSLTSIAEAEGLDLSTLKERLEKARVKLFLEREKRIHPHKDDKILTSWNGLMIAALAKGAQALGNSNYSAAASKAVEFIMTNLRLSNGRLLARYREGEAAFPGYIDDYAFLIWGLIELYEATFEEKYLNYALELNKDLRELFWDESEGGYFFYGEDGEELLARPKEIYDGATPSGNSVQALNLFRLARITGDKKLEEEAEAELEAFGGSLSQYPRAYAYFLTAVQFALWPTKEIIITGEKNNADTKAMVKTIYAKYLPEAVVKLNPNKDNQGKATAFICENFACQSPISNLDELNAALK